MSAGAHPARLLVLRTSAPAGRVQAIARWARLLLPTAVLVIAPVGSPQATPDGQEVISVDADELASGPLSMADAIVKAAAEGRKGGERATNG